MIEEELLFVNVGKFEAIGIVEKVTVIGVAVDHVNGKEDAEEVMNFVVSVEKLTN